MLKAVKRQQMIDLYNPAAEPPPKDVSCPGMMWTFLPKTMDAARCLDGWSCWTHQHSCELAACAENKMYF